MSSDDGQDGFLSRWSRRKRGLEAEPAPDDAIRPEADENAGADEPDTPAEDPELVANREAAEAVDLETLTYESDFTIFMKRGVPSALKNAALQKLWRSNPVLAVVDGLNDYDEDFRIAEGIAGQFQSAWKVGKGYADKAEEVTAEMEAKSAQLAEAREKMAAASSKQPEVEQAARPDGKDTPLDDQVLDEQVTDTVDPSEGETDLAEAKVETEGDDEAKAVKVPIRRRMSFSTE